MRARRVTSRTTAPTPAPVPAAQHNRLLAAAEARALDLEDRLVEILTPIFERAGDLAGDRFEARATRVQVASLRQTFPLLASAPAAASTMVAIKPTPAQAAMLSEPGGDPPEDMHVTLAYLGETEGDLSQIADALAGVPGAHGPLEGTVGGVGSFADGGKGHPSILLPSVPGLLELRHHVTEALTGASIDYGRDYGFVPHMTVAYRRNGPQPPQEASMGSPLNFDDLWVVRGDRETIQLPLTGAKPLTAAAEDDPSSADTLEEIARVAEDHVPDGGYGDTFWHEADRTVMWISADWSVDAEEAIEDFLAIPGVEWAEDCAECAAPKGPGWVRAYPRAADALEAASPPGHPPFCLPAELRTKTDPVRTAVVRTVMQAGVEGAGLSFDVTNPLAGKVLAQSGSQIVGIAKTTQLDVMKTVRYAYDQGLSIPDTAKAIRAAMRATAPSRARLIARTELAGAVNGSSLAATKLVDQATGAGYSKTWLTAPGAPYPRHEDYEGLDGQTVGLDEPFDVGGSDLQYPGDPDGPPEEICNCRCALRYADQGGEAEGIEAAAHLRASCSHHRYGPKRETAAELAIVMRSFAGGPADWIPPAPEELLSTECEPIRLPPVASTAVPAPSEPAAIRGDTVSVGAGPQLPAAIVERIQQLGLDRWPPLPGQASLEILRGAPSTEAIYRDAATGKWETERAAIHQEIIGQHFAGKVAPATGDQLHAYFTAGGGASGKGGLHFDVAGERLGTDALGERPDTILVDPDRIKQMLPEFREIVDARDAYAATAVHEESSYIAKAVVQEARARGYNVVLDTTGSSGGFVEKIKVFADAGYETQVSMVSVPTNEAIVRSMARGDHSGRYVSIGPLKGAHRGASEQLPRWMSSPDVDRWTLYDNSGPSSVLVAEGGGGETTVVYDQARLDEILAKAAEPRAS